MREDAVEIWTEGLCDGDASMAIGRTMAAYRRAAGCARLRGGRAGAGTGMDEAEKECHCRSSAVEASQAMMLHPPTCFNGGFIRRSAIDQGPQLRKPQTTPATASATAALHNASMAVGTPSMTKVDGLMRIGRAEVLNQLHCMYILYVLASRYLYKDGIMS